MDDLVYWEHIASKGCHFFDTLENDRNGIIVELVGRLSSADLTAGDLGCGPGKYLPLLSSRFRTVYAVDFCAGFLAIAQAAANNLHNVVLVKGDFANPRFRPRKVHFALCINVILVPSLPKIRAMLRGVWRSLERGGHLLLVVPSLESVLYTSFRSSERSCRSGRRAAWSGGLTPGRRSGTSIVDGVVKLGTRLTKHYLREELQVLLKDAGFEVISVEKVEYSWDTEFDEPPKWMKAPYPWDWLVLCQQSQ